MALPRVTCLLPTYNRLPDGKHLVEEAVESFLRQDYPNRQLIIINDTPGQLLCFSHPLVWVVNLPRRTRSLGEKLNLAVAEGDGELLCCWEDDDISLPWRLSLSVEMLGSRQYWRPDGRWFADFGQVYCDPAAGHNHHQAIYTRRLHHLTGGYPHTSGDQHQLFQERVARYAELASDSLDPERWFYIRRWDTGGLHLSMLVDEHGPAEACRLVGEMEVTPGSYELCPRWRADYVALTRAALAG